MDCSPFLNWNEDKLGSADEKAEIFMSLVATLKIQPALDDSLETKAVKILESAVPVDRESADAFLNSLGRTTDESVSGFVQSIVLIITLNPLSLSFTKAEDVHTPLISIVTHSVRLANPDGLRSNAIKAPDERQAIQETVLRQVLAPSEKYLYHLCLNRYSIVDGDQSMYFMDLLAKLVRLCPYYQPTMEFILHMPVVPTIPSCLTFIEDDDSIFSFLDFMVDTQHEWNQTREEVRQTRKTVDRMLRLEGFEDVIEDKLRNVKNTDYGQYIVAESIDLNNLQGMNLPPFW
ncbi:hypothetical protein BLNAU_9277 [Blattamonas nauphoetae]|uniref:Uncharacterized protein n=1 Tax=Blattamonas nauphoetae TaxID=2049346 RepID=A0ABQ9XW93_9EUKA|nr:hypothetical protein BLNAU_9277 [Blattamonas nauphoetae]